MNKKGFLDGKGFYIVLGLCALAIGVSSYILFFTTPTAPDENMGVYQPIIEEPLPAPTIKPEMPVIPEPEAPVINQVPVIEVPKTQTKPAATKPVTKLFLRPVPGEVVRKFSSEDLSFDKTMGDWRVHLGSDFVAKQGDRVYAVTEGTVKEISADALYGTCVTMQHSDGLTVVYAGLESKVKVGAKLKAGDIIGTCSGLIDAESEDPTHIHVTAMKNGKDVDIETLIPSVKK